MKTTRLAPKSFKYALLPLALAAAIPAVEAAQVDVTWVNPESFSDVEASWSTQARFRDRVMTDLEAQFRKSGERLPADQTLFVSVLDVDLAGYVDYFQPGAPFGVRLIRDIDFPRIKLDYELRDADGMVVTSGSSKLADLGFHFPTFATRLRNPLDYEKHMIDQWYAKNF